jgi:hypothetical protein
VQLPGEPPNKFPQLVRKLVKDLKACCPTLGKVKLAKILARAGLHLAASTVGRMLKENGGQSVRTPPKDESPAGGEGDGPVVTAKRRNHVWHVDLTVVPTGPGLYCPWLPRALPQRWPFVYWVAVVVDHFSRRVMGCAGLPGPRDRAGKGHAEVHYLRPRAAVRQLGIPGLVQAQGNQAAALRRGGPARFNRCGGAVHSYAQMPVALPAPDPLSARGVSARARYRNRLVQRPSAAHDARRSHAG